MANLLALANLEFEYELAGLEVPPKVRAYCRRWRRLLRLLPGWEEADWEPGTQAAALAVWGVSPAMVELARELGLESTLPSPEVVREVNDKRFSHHLEREWGQALPGATLVDTLESLRAAVARCPFDWVLKHPFGVSGRERMLGRQGRLTDSVAGWARRRLKSGALLFEPWVRERVDFSHHFEVSVQGEVQFLGSTELLSDAGGVYRGNRVVGSMDEVALDWAQKAAQEVAQRGYWGPVGIDGLRGNLGEVKVERSLVEINARYSFGRLTLALAGRLPEGWCLSWWHTQPDGALPPFEGAAESGVYSLPRSCDPDGESGTFLVVAPDAKQLRALERALNLVLPAAPVGT